MSAVSRSDSEYSSFRPRNSSTNGSLTASSAVLPGFWFYAGVDLLIMMGAARDLLVNRKIHRVYLIALPLLIAGQIVISQITSTESWKRFAHAILF